MEEGEALLRGWVQVYSLTAWVLAGLGLPMVEVQKMVEDQKMAVEQMMVAGHDLCSGRRKMSCVELTW